MQRLFASTVWRAQRQGGFKKSLQIRARTYSQDSLLKGTPRFTRVKPKLKGKDRFDEYVEASDGAINMPYRLELNAKNVCLLLMKAGVVITFGGTVAFVVYCTGSYYYVTRHWPLSSEVEGFKTRSLVYLATYYDRISQDSEKALPLYNKACKHIESQGSVCLDSFVVLQMKARMGECLYRLGNLDEAEVLLNETIPLLQNLSIAEGNEEHASQATLEHETKPTPNNGMFSLVDERIYQASFVLVQIYRKRGQVDEAKRAFRIGIQAVQRMKKDITAHFDSSNLVSYSIYEDAKVKEAVLTSLLGEILYTAKEAGAAKTLFRSVLGAVKQHKAQLKMTPRVIIEMRTYVNEWECLDTTAMVYLAKIHIDEGNVDAAVPLLNYATETAVYEVKTRLPVRCVNCEADILSQFGRIAEIQGDNKMALRKYHEAHEHARIYYGDFEHELLRDYKRFQDKLKQDQNI
ncbi:hypothetical protein LPJ81_003727 [Coemansia sp. IMI 209127]|nr:hypothetical protein LPJ81_003727 [Coemansia sp. IMI 209127]